MTDESNLRVRPYIRWMISRDMPEVMGVERESFEFPWSEDDFLRCLRQRNCIGMVADLSLHHGDDRDQIAAFVVYGLYKSRLHIFNLAVDPSFRRQGVGTLMVEKLKSKLSIHRRSRLLLEVRETNLPAQLFLRSQGFRAISVLRDFYEETTEDAYLFQYRYAESEADGRRGRQSRYGVV